MKKLSAIGLLLLLAGYFSSEVEGFECYSCWSNVTAACAVGPVQVTTPTTCQDSDSCLTAIVDGATYRGCSSSLPLPEDYQLKTTCQSEFCNTQIFPANRLYCFKCEGDACNAPTGKSRPCVNYFSDDKCYTDVISNITTVRGCISDGNFTVTPYTETCNTNLCNDVESVSMLECVSCISTDDVNCVRSAAGGDCQITVTDTCKIEVLLGRTEYCYTSHVGNVVQRGCSSSAIDTVPPVVGRDDYTECNTSSCNNVCIPESACYTCNSLQNPDCSGNLSVLQPETCTGLGVSSCFSCFQSDGNVTRGCGSEDLSDLCVACEVGDGCNNHTMSMCYNCTSADDPNCSQWTNPYEIATTACMAQCITKIVNETTLVRGCESDTFNCASDDASCISCSGDLCNNDVVPAGKLKCYQCDGTIPCLNITEADQPQLCMHFDPNDQCIQYLSGNNMLRGCLSGNIGAGCLNQNESCVKCDTPGCNDIPFLRQANLSCIHCGSGDNCMWGYSPDSGTKCTNSVLYYENDTCYTNNYTATYVSRGCTSDGGCDSLGSHCDYCDTDNCNTDNVAWQSCIQCSSGNSTKTDCIDANYGSTKCPGKLITFEDRGCYVKRTGRIISRGCLADMDKNDRELCSSNNNKDCLTCLTQDCNKQLMDNSSGNVQLSLTIFIVSILTLFLFRN